MSAIINDLVRKLKRAERARAKANKEWETALTEEKHASDRLKECHATVRELESAISLLRNNLKPSAAPTDEKVVPLKSR